MGTHQKKIRENYQAMRHETSSTDIGTEDPTITIFQDWYSSNKEALYTQKKKTIVY